MTGSIPQSVEGSQAPNALELLWERNRGLVQGAFWLLALGLLCFYGLKYYNQMQVNEKWSRFATAALLRATYCPERVEADLGSSYEAVSRILDDVRDTPTEKFDQAMAQADQAQMPFLLWLSANHSARNGEYEKAQQLADRLAKDFPSHPLSAKSDYPIQVREPVKADKDKKEKDKKKDQTDKEPELVEPVAGSQISQLLAGLQKAKEFVEPPQFKQPEIPADAPKYRITFDGEYGSCVIALMSQVAPKTCAKFEEIVGEKFWDGVKVDEIARPGKHRWSDQSFQIHFGFESTKTEANRADWDTTSASKEGHVVEEVSPLSHFPGAVAARSRDGKSEVDRLYLCASDCAAQDDSRQVFGFVVEGLENVKRICESSFDRSEDEDSGRGRPAESIAIKSVEKL